MNEPRDSQTPDPEDARREAWARGELTRKAAKLQGPCAFRPGEVWRFRDGREGIVASANAQQVIVYVGPQAFTLPVGDWPAIVLGASPIRESAPADGPVAVETPAVQPIEPSPAPPPVVTEPELAAEPPESWGEWAQRTSVVPYSEPEALVEEVAEAPSAPPTYPRDASRGRKDRKRKP